MRRLIFLLLGVVVGGLLMYGSFQYHLVRSQRAWLIVPKRQTSLNDIYVDIREWKLREWRQHPSLAQDLVASGHSDLVETSMKEGFFRGLFGPLRDGSWLNGKPASEVPKR
jgi:hypothetical protein